MRLQIRWHNHKADHRTAKVTQQDKGIPRRILRGSTWLQKGWIRWTPEHSESTPPPHLKAEGGYFLVYQVKLQPATCKLHGATRIATPACRLLHCRQLQSGSESNPSQEGWFQSLGPASRRGQLYLASLSGFCSRGSDPKVPAIQNTLQNTADLFVPSGRLGFGLAHRKQVPCCLFGLSLARPHGQRSGHQAPAVLHCSTTAVRVRNVIVTKKNNVHIKTDGSANTITHNNRFWIQVEHSTNALCSQASVPHWKGSSHQVKRW